MYKTISPIEEGLDLGWVKLILQAKVMGITVEEIREFLKQQTERSCSCSNDEQ